jgi:hypothetical protein
MGLSYNCGKGRVELTKSWAKKNLGLDVYLCCPGPSLANVNPEDFKIPGVFTVGLNTSYPYIKPNLWIGMDKPGCYDPRLWWEPFNKICRKPFWNETVGDYALKDLPNVLFADISKADNIKEIFTRRAHDTSFVWRKNTLITALHFIIWMGARRIFLVGCDFGGEKDYYDDRELSDGNRQYNKRLYSQQVECISSLKKDAVKYGIDIRSCTPSSPVNEKISYLPLEEALDQSSKRVPIINSPIEHCLNINQNAGPSAGPKGDKGVEGEPGIEDPPLQVFIGAEPQELVSSKTLEYTIFSQSSIPVTVKPLFEALKEKELQIPVPNDPANRPKTNFSFHRWCIPALCNYKGKALYCDSDQIVFEDVAKLLELFKEYPDKSVIILSDKKHYIETSVMLIDCERARWDIGQIVDKLNSNELNYNSLMFEMGHMKPWEYIVGVDSAWNSLDHYVEGKTKLLHYTNRATQPWIKGLSEHTNLWLSKLKLAIQNGYLSKELVERYVKKNIIGKTCLKALE